MGLRNIFKNSSNQISNKNIELLEEHDLLNVVGSPNKLFLKFLKAKNINIEEDEVTEELISEFEESLDVVELKFQENQKQKELIFKQRKVWINICLDGRWQGSDLLLDHEGLTVDLTDQKIPYSRMLDIEISDGGWSKDRISIITLDGELFFTINENYSSPLKEIIEDNMNRQTHDEIDDLLDLHELFEWGLISEEEFENKKAEIYQDSVYCTNCGFKLDKDSDFCSNCGYEILD